MDSSGVLKEYVEKQDEEYEWEVDSEDTFFGSRVCNINLKSQRWKGIKWKHRLKLVSPEQVKKKNLLLLISGSGHGFEELVFCKTLSDQLGLPSAVLCDVPNQPLFDGLYEDALISFTFSNFIKTGDEEWPLLLPMVKAASRSMDCLEEFFETRGERVEGFIVTGASKRGWTTWLVSAVDKRAKAIAPMVFDNLNLFEQMKHQVECYGTYSEQIADYVNLKPLELLQSEVGQRLSRIVDPYCYRGDIGVPKLIINGTNDRYWTVDSLNLYYDGLIGEKRVLYVPNSGHALEDRRRVISSISALTHSVVSGAKLPEVVISFEEGRKTLQIFLSDKPLFVDIWVAISGSMDFRDSRWISYPAFKEDNLYSFPLSRVDKYLAAFVEAVFVSEGITFSLSSKMTVLRPF
ncbi:MAG: PhoPQ-activated protein PqaA family protein [Thermoproteota archaeon]